MFSLRQCEAKSTKEVWGYKNITAISGNKGWHRSVCSSGKVSMGMQSSGVRIWRWMINFGKGIERSKEDYLWARKSPVVKCIFQHRSLQHSRWSFVSLSKPTDRWKDREQGSRTGLGAVSEVFILLIFVCCNSKQLLRPAISKNCHKNGSEKQDFFCFCNGYRNPSIYVICATPNCLLFYSQNAYNSQKILNNYAHLEVEMGFLKYCIQLKLILKLDFGGWI